MDDSRLSKLVRRAGREDERERRLLAIRQLKDYLLQTENAKVVHWVPANIYAKQRLPVAR